MSFSRKAKGWQFLLQLPPEHQTMLARFVLALKIERDILRATNKLEKRFAKMMTRAIKQTSQR